MSGKPNTDEMSAAAIAAEIGHCRQYVWTLLRTGKIAHARQVAGRWWVAPREDVLTYKQQMAKK